MSGRRLLLAAVLLASLTAGACVRVPDSGPVVETTVDAGPGGGSQYSYNPRPPQPGESAPEIVQHFLEAMTATSHETTVARQFLTQEAQAAWDPELEIITYAEASAPAGTSDVTIQLSEAQHYDRQGSWRGELPDRRRRLTFPMGREDGEWRIARVPDALIVPQEWFDARYRQASLYYFDPTGEVLVPEPVFVPRGDKFASSLVRNLLIGPAARHRGVERSYLPEGSSLELSVVVDDGVARVTLQGVGETLTGDTVPRVVAQLAWTLRQDPAIQRIALTVDGSRVTGPGPGGTFPVTAGGAVTPAVADATSRLYGVQQQRLVTVADDRATPVAGPFGAGEFATEQATVDIDGEQAAVVTTGQAVFVGPLTADAEVVEVAEGRDLLRPHWDFRDQLWLVDRHRLGAVVTVGPGEPGRRRVVRVPGVTGRRVSSFLVSRDGSRLVATVRGPQRDAVLVSRVQRNGDGRVVGLTRAEQLLVTDPGRRVADLTWGSPSQVLALTRGDLTQLRRLPVDGSPRRTSDTIATSLGSPARALAGSPVEGAPPLVVGEGEVLDVDDVEAGADPLPPGVTGLGYAG